MCSLAREPVLVAKQRHVRAGDTLDDDDLVVVRGGQLDAEVLRADARRYFAVYAEFGISVFAARGITVDELAQQPPPVRFEVLTLVGSVCSERWASGWSTRAGTLAPSPSRSTISTTASPGSRAASISHG